MKNAQHARPPATPTLDFSHLHSVRLLPKHCTELHLIQVGCGGIGAQLASSTARIARECQRLYESVRISFFDGDLVEQKNIRRQNFCDSEVGQNKAEAVAYRLNMAWGLDIAAFPTDFKGNRDDVNDRHNTLTILLGCVDTAAARHTLHLAIAEQTPEHDGQVWWLDGGNLSVHGQICLGNTGRPDVLARSFDLPNICQALPSPAVLHPELLKSLPDEQPEKRQSCADLAIRDPQSLTINTVIAAHMADYLLRLVVTKDLRRFATYIDMDSGSVRSLAITPTQVQRSTPTLSIESSAR